MSIERTERLAQTNFWDRIFALRDRQRAEHASGLQIVREEELPLEINRQGLMRWYMHPEIRDTAVSTMLFFEQEIPPGSRSGRLKFQGGQVIVILEGAGYTMLNGVKHTWEAGDLLNIPIPIHGVVMQHFNPDPAVTVKFVACEMNWLECATVDRGSGFEQIEDAPEYREQQRAERERG